MRNDESEIDMVRRHIREGEGRIERQRAIVAESNAAGRPVEIAADMLEAFEKVQALHEAHLARLSGELKSRCPETRAE